MVIALLAMREALPPMDNLARALLMRGARDAAVMLLKAASRRGGEDKGRCEALLAAVQARPNDRVSGPPLSIDAELVESVAAAGRLFEARALALGADVSRNVAGVEIAAALEEIFLPTEDWPTGWRIRWNDALASGVLSSMTGLEREVSVSQDPPPQLAARAAIALRLLRGFSLTGATHVRDPLSEFQLPVVSEEARDRILAKLTAADLPGALREAHTMAFEGRTGVNEVAIVLGRLVTASERAQSEGAGQKLASTVPLGGPGMALFQLRMGNLAEAQRIFRGMINDNPGDYVAREHLTDLVALERALGIEQGRASPPEPPSRAPSTEWLDKRQRKASMEGWATRPKPVEAADWENDSDSTSVMKSDHEAELLLKSGHPERALALYEALVRRYPDRPRFAQRMEEIEAMIQARSAPMTIEPTVRRDVLPRAKLERENDPLAQTGRDDSVPQHVESSAAESPFGSPFASPGPSPFEAAPEPEPEPEPALSEEAARGFALAARFAPYAGAGQGTVDVSAPTPATDIPTRPVIPSSRPLVRASAPPPSASAPIPNSRPMLRAQPPAQQESEGVHRLDAGTHGATDSPVAIRRIVTVG